MSCGEWKDGSNANMWLSGLAKYSKVPSWASRILGCSSNWRAAELKAALIARSRMIDGAGPPTTRYGLLDPDNYRSDP